MDGIQTRATKRNILSCNHSAHNRSQMKQKYHGVSATLERETPDAILADVSHADYGSMPGLWIPKSVIHEDSLTVIEEAADGDDVELFVAAWWFRKNFGEITPQVQSRPPLRRPIHKR